MLNSTVNFPQRVIEPATFGLAPTTSSEYRTPQTTGPPAHLLINHQLYILLVLRSQQVLRLPLGCASVCGSPLNTQKSYVLKAFIQRNVQVARPVQSYSAGLEINKSVREIRTENLVAGRVLCIMVTARISGYTIYSTPVVYFLRNLTSVAIKNLRTEIQVLSHDACITCHRYIGA